MKFSLKFPEDLFFDPATMIINNDAPVAELLRMMKLGQKLSIRFFVNKYGQMTASVESMQVARYPVVMFDQLYKDLLLYLKFGAIPKGDYPDDVLPIICAKNTRQLHEFLIREWIENGLRVQWVPKFRVRSRAMVGLVALPFGNIHLAVDSTEDFQEFLLSHGYSIAVKNFRKNERKNS